MSVSVAEPAPFSAPAALSPSFLSRPALLQLVQHAKAYQGADHGQSWRQLAVTFSGFACFAGLVVACQLAGLWALSVGLMLPAAGFLIRLFIIQHDCGHGSFFNKRHYNNSVGRFISLFTFTPYDFWRRSHNMHHAHSGNIDRRGIGGVDTITVAEYQALPRDKRILYRLFRNPALLLLVVAPVNIMVFQRFPPNRSVPWLSEYHSMAFSECWQSILGLDVALAAFYGALAYALGWQVVVFGLLPIVYLTAILGGWLFYIQHQFEHTFWRHEAEWNFNEAALYSSSHYILPPVLRWFSGSIGLHHLHHFNAKIPNYRLQPCVNASPELQQMNRMTFRQSLKCLRWALWDEKQQKMVGFADLETA